MRGEGISRTPPALSQAEFERLLGTGPKTVVRWERSTVTQSSTADTLMRVLMKHPEALYDLALELDLPARGAAAGGFGAL